MKGTIGNKISQLRNQQGLTQKELADLCSIDIRTIQRIESGEVIPRKYTLKLLANALNSDINDFDIKKEIIPPVHKELLLPIIAGILFSANYIPVIVDLITQSISGTAHIVLFTIHTIACIPFMQGLYFVGRNNKNQLLAIPSLLAMILLPMMGIMELFRGHFYSMGYSILAVACINAIVSGVGLFLEGNKRRIHPKINLYKLAGTTTIIQSIMFLNADPDIIALGLIISACCNMITCLILWMEYRMKEWSMGNESTLA